MENALVDPKRADETAPETFEVEFDTTTGLFRARFHRNWAPHGVDRLYNLVDIGYFRNIAFFRVIEDFMAQFGIHGDPRVNEAWSEATIPDDEVDRSNQRGTISFAQTRKPDSRTTQLFINLTDNPQLDEKGFAPIGRVVEGMDSVDEIYSGYGEGAPRGNGPNQKRLRIRGAEYLEEEFPELDYIESAQLK